jgi:transcriptional regulator GlxA family with amidase domain
VLARESPACAVDADRMVCADGPVTTAGAAFAHADLMLHLLRARFGPALVDAVSRWLLLEPRHSQAPFIAPEVLASGHSLVKRLTARLEGALPDVPGIAELARELCVSQKTLARHVRKATGKGTGEFVRSLRLRRARALLQDSRMTIDQVAAAVGYQDATALRRLMRQSTGASPSHFRQAATVAG